MRPGRLELSADGTALEVHYEVRAAPRCYCMPAAAAVSVCRRRRRHAACTPASPPSSFRHTCPRLPQTVEVAVLPDGREVAQSGRPGVKR